MILKNENDIYIFFEIIGQLKPQRILDVGMFLKRVGSISRKIMNQEVPEAVKLDGVDFYSEINFPVWKNIYNRIIDAEEFGKKEEGSKYELAVLLGIKELQKKMPVEKIMEKIKASARYILIDEMVDKWQAQYPQVKVIDLKVEQNIYFLIDFGE